MESKVREIEVEVLPADQTDGHDFARLLAWILNDLIPIPGTKFRVGLDPLIGLIPGIGDTSSTAFASLIIIRAMKAGVPRVVLARMAANLLINALVGAIPGIGDVFSAWFKSNRLNYQLLQKHSQPGFKQVSTAADWTFLIVLLGVVLILTIALALATAWLAWNMLRLLFGT
jgi:hypothetical protein